MKTLEYLTPSTTRLTSREISNLIDRWREDLITVKKYYKSGQHVFTVSPDYVSLGYDVYPIAIKNRQLGLMVCPHKEGLISSFNGNASSLVSKVSNLYEQPSRWEFVEERWQNVRNGEATIWPTVHVQNPSLDMATCDLATLQQAAAPALELYLAQRIKSISRSGFGESEQDYIKTQYRLLNLEMPKPLEVKWQVAIAKKRLLTPT